MPTHNAYQYDASDTALEGELQDWLLSLDEAVRIHGKDWGERVLKNLRMYAQSIGVNLPLTSVTPYANTIPAALQPAYPGDLALEERITSLLRWNAMVMVHRANTGGFHQGGHIATFASSAYLYEVGQHHFFRGAAHPQGPDFVYFQGHASPGMYARAFLEGRLEETHLVNFRRETQRHPGLSSYPHPWLMPAFWQFPTVSMGLGPISAIYHARFIRYLEDRGLKPAQEQKVWAFLGDGETDEPEALGAINLAAREGLDNLIFVINCNLQRLDGPVRGNGKIIQELEGTFRGSGWKVLKVIWGSDWDPLFARDPDNRIVRRAGEIVDGQFQKYSVEPGWYMRDHFFGTDPRLLELVEGLPDDRLKHLNRGGHDPLKIHAAYRAAMSGDGRPTVILVKTIKGYGMDEAGEGLNIAHNAKVMPAEALRAFRDRFDLPFTDADLETPQFYRPAPKSAEIRYLLERRRALGGFVPERTVRAPALPAPEKEVFAEFHGGSEDRPASTTMVFVRLLSKLLKDESVGPYLVPIVPDESRTFGLDALFRQVGIYARSGQLYEPVDKKNVLYYREARDGQILEEGITEAGSMASFTAAGTAYANHAVPTVPIYMFYSMFGFQRTGDQVWLNGDARSRGFFIGCTAGRTTLNGEGLQHQDGQSHTFLATVPNAVAYDPAYSYEIAVIMADGLRRLTREGEDRLYYLTLYNENYCQPPMPKGVEEGILRGLYRLREAPTVGARAPAAQIFGSGTLLNAALEAQTLLAEDFGVAATVWSATSYQQLRADCHAGARTARLRPGRKAPAAWLQRQLADAPGPVVAVSDHHTLLPDSLARWIEAPYITLGTDGYGRSDTRADLRAHFEIDARHIAYSALAGLLQSGVLKPGAVKKARKQLDLDPDKVAPVDA